MHKWVHQTGWWSRHLKGHSVPRISDVTFLDQRVIRRTPWVIWHFWNQRVIQGNPSVTSPETFLFPKTPFSSPHASFFLVRFISWEAIFISPDSVLLLRRHFIAWEATFYLPRDVFISWLRGHFYLFRQRFTSPHRFHLRGYFHPSRQCFSSPGTFSSAQRPFTSPKATLYFSGTFLSSERPISSLQTALQVLTSLQVFST